MLISNDNQGNIIGWRRTYLFPRPPPTSIKKTVAQELIDQMVAGDLSPKVHRELLPSREDGLFILRQ
jgi:hypothetical protein